MTEVKLVPDLNGFITAIFSACSFISHLVLVDFCSSFGVGASIEGLRSIIFSPSGVSIPSTSAPFTRL